LIKWAFSKKGDPTPEDVPYSISIMDHTTGETTNISQKQGMHPHKTLGAYLSPDSQHVKKLIAINKKRKKEDPPIPLIGQQVMERKAREFLRAIFSSQMNKYKGQLMHRQIFAPSMKYGLHVLNMTDEAMDDIQAK
jgi:hypothetical protein